MERLNFDFVYFTLSQREKSKILKKVQELLAKDENIFFAFVHGSFLRDVPFRDIDIAVMLSSGDSFEYTINKSVQLETKVGFPVDLHMLNGASVIFAY